MNSPATPTPPPNPSKPAFTGHIGTSVRSHRRWPYVAGAILLLLIVAGLWPKAIPVELTRATRGTLQVSVEDEGRTRVKNRYIVASPVAGQLRRIELKPGAIVEAGKTPLASLETRAADFLDASTLAQAEARLRAAEAARDQAAAMLERARAAFSLARTELNRTKSIFEKGGASKQELDLAVMHDATATQENHAAEFSLRVAEHELTQIRALVSRGKTGPADNIEPLLLTSPVDGRVLRVFQESSRVVVAGTPLLEVGDPTDLEIEIEVLSRDGVGIRPGATVWLDQWGGSEPLQAHVRLVEPSAFTKISALGVEEQRVLVIADFVDPVEKRSTLGDAYRVEGRVVIWEGSDILKIPSGALFQKQDKWFTYVVDGSHVRLREIKAGRSNGTETQVLEGLQPNDRVIVYPGDRVADGVRVKAIDVASH